MSQTSLNKNWIGFMTIIERNRRFYSHHTRPARFSTHEIREGPVRKKYSPFAFSREIGDFILTIPDPRGSRPTRSAKVRFEKCILHSLFQQPRILMTHVTNVAE